MAYKEIKLPKGAAKALAEGWTRANDGNALGKKKAPAKKPAPKKGK